MTLQLRAMAFTISLVILAGSPAFAKDLASRLGVGYSNQFSTDLPALTAKYFPANDLALSAALGVDSGTSNSKFGLLFKVTRVVFPEEHMNFYMGAGAGLLSTKVGTTNESGFELLGVAGAEFFFSGLESLGFSFEAGVGILSVQSGVTFRTIGDNPFKGSVIFYF